MMTVQEITRDVEKEAFFIEKIFQQIDRVIVGKRQMIERMLIGLFTSGHILLEGVPGLAKTTAVKTLSLAINTRFQRIQFTPDLLPADLIGTQIYSPREGTFSIKKGPIFTNILLADEINRAPAKVQSALLEAMQEHQVTIGEETIPLEAPFLVMATQNPIEQEGTYPLPEAQVDRFMLKLKVDYPDRTEEIRIMKTKGRGPDETIEPVIRPEDIFRISEVIDRIYIDDKLYDYIADIVFATREPAQFGLSDLEKLIDYGVSPRASLFLVQTSKAYAFLQGRGFVTPQDIKTIGMDVLRHRVLISYEAEARDMTSEDIIFRIFDTVNVP
jgi:MoxR-like ATPase